MIEPGTRPDDRLDLTDETLAELERSAERCSSVDRGLPEACNDDRHHQMYAFIDALSLPVRTALVSPESPPTLNEYGELVEIGRGGMGVVYRGQHTKTKRFDAIKIIRTDRLSRFSELSPRQLEDRLHREAQLAARVAHEHIVPVYQVGDLDGCPWYSMQLVDGQNLHQLSRQQPLDPEKAAAIIEQIARAVDTVHRHGILHGDIKPHNILIEQGSGRPLITDFGLAGVLESMDMASGIAGTPAYMSPELARAAIQSQPPEAIAGIRSIAADIYSLGATLLSLLTGQSPCSEELNQREQLEAVADGRLRYGRELDSALPKSLVSICRKCLAIDPRDRYSTAGELADALSTWLNRPRWNRHFPKLRYLLSMVVAPLIAISGVLVWWFQRTQAPEPLIWLVLFAGYVPLFGAFAVSQNQSLAAHRAQRELWSIWLGNIAASLTCLISLRILCHPDFDRAMELFYPAWSALASVVFFAKSGNFWSGYRWIGALWTLIPILMVINPKLSPIVFGICAAATCVLIACMDDAFQDR